MSQGASDWLETQLADLEAKLAKSGDALFKFKQEHDIVSTSWEDRQSIVSQRIVAINDALTKARVLKAQLSARNEQLAQAVDALENDPQSPDGTMLLTQNMAIPELKVRYLDAKVECADQAAHSTFAWEAGPSTAGIAMFWVRSIVPIGRIRVVLYRLDCLGKLLFARELRLLDASSERVVDGDDSLADDGLARNPPSSSRRCRALA